MKQVFAVASQARVALGRLDGLLQALAEPGAPFLIGSAGAEPLEARSGQFETLTSGSSGQPRRIRRTMASWTRSFAVNAGLFGIRPGARVAVLGAMEHSLALYGAVEALHLGAELYALAGLRPDRQRRVLAEAGVQILYATPAQLRQLAAARGAELADLRLILVGGSKLDAALVAAVLAMAPRAGMREFYGAAEASFITLAGPGDPPGSVGRPYPGVEIEIRGMGDGGKAGEVWLRSAYLFLGYAGANPGGARWQDGWLTVGEMGWMEGGCLSLAGRVDRMVTIADHNVFPEEIEGFLAGLGGIELAAVLPRADPRRGVHLVAMVQGDSGVEAAVMAALRARFGALKAPKALIWRQDWPYLPSGKMDLRALAAEVAV